MPERFATPFDILDATPEDESKGVANVDNDSEATPLSKPKGKAKTGDHVHMGALPSSSRSMSLATEVERLRGDAVVKSFDKPLTPNKLIIEAHNANDVAQSQLHILEFRVEGELGERQVFHLREEDEDMEVNKYINHTEKAIDVNEATGPSDLEPFHGKGMLLKHKVIQLVNPFTLIKSYKRKKVGDGHSAEDFVALDPLWIIQNPDVEVFIDVLMRWVGSPR
ncbi:hypothetical protein FF2_022035 [Malus domestica]